MGTLVASRVQAYQLPRPQEYGPISLFLAPGSWQSEGLFGSCFPAAWPIQAITGPLGSFSVSQQARHLQDPLVGVLNKRCSVAQSCPTLCNPMDCSPSASSALGIFQARILQWGASSSSVGSSQPRD